MILCYLGSPSHQKLSLQQPLRTESKEAKSRMKPRTFISNWWHSFSFQQLLPFTVIVSGFPPSHCFSSDSFKQNLNCKFFFWNSKTFTVHPLEEVELWSILTFLNLRIGPCATQASRSEENGPPGWYDLKVLPHRQIKYPVDFDDELKNRKRQIR